MIYVNVRAIIERDGPNGTEIIIQKRVKPKEEETPYELPGGRLDKYEPWLEGLKREVREETGLHLTRVFGEETRLETKVNNTNVEALKPFAVYQTIKGPVDSLGVYFRCQASGSICEKGDETEDIQWISVAKLQNLLDREKIDFSWVDTSGILYYLKWSEARR